MHLVSGYASGLTTNHRLHLRRDVYPDEGKIKQRFRAGLRMCICLRAQDLRIRDLAEMHILNLQDAYPEMGRKINGLGQNRTAGCQKQVQDAYPKNSGYTSIKFAECEG